MILCPNCHRQELPGALFCSECGASLMPLSGTQLFTSSTGENIKVTNTLRTAQTSIPSQAIDSVLSLQLVESGKLIHLTGQSEFTLGRVTEGQPILPDVDLSPFEAYTHGVSRLHASIRVADREAEITDFGSSNGTRVNGQKITPHVPFLLHHGDVISLGRLKVQILLKK